jgi:hypothetical protein
MTGDRLSYVVVVLAAAAVLMGQDSAIISTFGSTTPTTEKNGRVFQIALVPPTTIREFEYDVKLT